MAQQTLERLTFRTSRSLDFCSEKELIAQTGHGPADWPLVVIKELLDNALDACEEARIPPAVSIVVDNTGIAIQDNGPGLKRETIDSILDYNIKVSSREAYMAPDRGAQGNALKTIAAMPFVLDGKEGKVVISSQGMNHNITFKVDRIRQEPRIDLASEKSSIITKGTTIRVCWPNCASSIIEDQKDRFLQIAEDYTWLNPHLTLVTDWFGCRRSVEATAPNWTKWSPSDPTSAHWYDVPALRRLIAAYIRDDEDNGRERLVREFVSEFRGFAGSAKQKRVLESTGLTRQPLAAFVKNDDIDTDLACSLLESMQRESKPVKPQALGIIGKDHIEAKFQEAGGVPESFRYKRVLSKVTDPLPEVYECGFGYCPSQKQRRLATGVNWSPGIVNPFRRLSDYRSMDQILQEAWAGPGEPIILFLHVASPVVHYTDRGKSAVVVS